MRSVWMVVSGFAMAVAIGGAVYYLLPRQSAEPDAGAFSVPPQPSTGNRVLVVPADNPLLTASRGQLDRWVPLYPIRCGEILFEKADAHAKHFSRCVEEIRSRVAHYTGASISRNDVLDPRVKAHWQEVMGAK
ncbi:hypothetical protein AB870_26510 (plasmid) [Pandoraea faecigallinarum]|uniref:Uncharacterized protein n=1 Tax=Pandoraea faecigallinarum TaxID=656179 RepID=A0A1D8X6F9_9BURK|nr:hypothetical protein [Pandoraea faecigallinarum]AOX47856.1 hypothetical protein AB870_26510 [Pandoraea faecigallinarum]